MYSLPVRLRTRQLPRLSPRLTDPWPPRMMVSPGHARGASIPLHWFEKNYLLCLLRRPRGGAVLARVTVRSFCTQKPTPREYGSWARPPVLETGSLLPVKMERRNTAGGSSLLAWRFAFSVLGDPHTSCMTCGPGSPCQRLGRFGARGARWARAGESSLKRDSPRMQQLLFRILSFLLRPFAFRAFCAALHSCSPAPHLCHRRRHGFAWPTRPLPDRGDARCGAQLAWMGCASARREDPRWCRPPRRPPRRGVRFVHLLHLLWVGAANLALLPDVVGVQPPASAPHPHSILQAAIFAHLCEMFMGVAPCTSLFRISLC
jgi:hypothetical protein